MKKCILIFLVTTVSLAGSVKLIQSQDIPDPVFYEQYQYWANDDDPRSYESVKKEFATDLRNGNWAIIFKGLLDDFENTSTDWDGNEKIYRKFHAELDSLVGVFLNIYYLKEAAYINHLDKINSAQFTESTGDQFIFYFKPNPNQFVICPDNTFAECEDQPVLTKEQALDIRYRGNTINELLELFTKEPREIILKRIEESHKRWVNFMDNGYTMFPWESSLNAKYLNWTIKSPPAWQIILLHPGLGIQLPMSLVSDFNAIDIRVSQSLYIEVLGILKYRGDFNNNYTGFSGTIVLRDDIGPGIGINTHLSRRAALGLNWHFSDEEDKTFIKYPYLNFNLNVLGWFKSNRSYIDRLLP